MQPDRPGAFRRPPGLDPRIVRADDLRPLQARDVLGPVALAKVGFQRGMKRALRNARVVAEIEQRIAALERRRWPR